MAICPGRRKDNKKCNSVLYRCKKCGNVGCKQSRPGECSNQGFTLSGQCLKCGTYGKSETFK